MKKSFIILISFSIAFILFLAGCKGDNGSAGSTNNVSTTADSIVGNDEIQLD